MTTFANRIRARLTSRREDPFAETALLQPPGTAPTTMLRATGPATDVSGPDTGTMPRIPAAPPEDFQFRGEWDTRAQRHDVAKAFRPSPAVQRQLAQIREQADLEHEQARRDQARLKDEQTAYWDRPDDLMVSEHTGPAVARAYAPTPVTPDQTRFDLAAGKWEAPFSAAECWGHAELVPYWPVSDPSCEQLAATLQQWGELTGTWTEYQQPRAWANQARSAPRSAPLAPLTVEGLQEVPDDTVKPGAQLAVIEEAS